MEVCLLYFKNCFGVSTSNINLINENNLESNVVLDTLKAGNDVVIIKNGSRICGTGAALGNIPINQDKAYFELKIQQEGEWGVGLANKNINLNVLPLSNNNQADLNYCVLTSSGDIIQNNKIVHSLKNKINLNDVIGVAYDHIELKFYINNNFIEKSFQGLKGELYPIFYIDKGAILDASFNSFHYEPPAGFDRIMIEKTLL